MTAYDTLNDRHRRFVDEYMVDLSATNAAIRAGYGKAGAHTRANELLKREDVKAAIAEKHAVRSEEAGDRAARAAQRLEAIALMDLGEGHMRAVPPPLLNVVRTATVDLLKLDGKFKDEVEHTGTITVVISADDAGLL